jgi:hypothetical protein
MSGAIPPFPNTSSWRGDQLRNSTRTILPLPLRVLFHWMVGLCAALTEINHVYSTYHCQIFLDSRNSEIVFSTYTMGLGIFLFTTVSRTALGPTHHPIQCVPGALSMEVKRPKREADRSCLSSAEVNELVELYIHSPSTPSWRCAQFKKKHRDNFTYTMSFRDECPLHSYATVQYVLLHWRETLALFIAIDYWFLNASLAKCIQNERVASSVRMFFLRNYLSD